MRSIALTRVVPCAVALAGALCAGPLAGAERYQGRPLAEVLDALRAEGLSILYSSHLVPRRLKVMREPTAESPRRKLEQILAPHGLRVRSGPGRRLLVVSAPRKLVHGIGSARSGARFRESLVVSAARDANPAGPSPLPVAPRDVTALAGVGDNVFRVLQTFPGVVGTDEFDSRLSVRGGSPNQNLTIMDGVEIHSPFSAFGLVSAFNPEAVESFDVSTGVPDVRYGDRLSSVLVVRNRAGREDRSIGGAAAASSNDASLTLEGRLPGGPAGSWMLAARHTHFGLLADRLIDYYNLPRFADLQAQVSWQLGPARRLTWTGLINRDATDYRDYQRWLAYRSSTHGGGWEDHYDEVDWTLAARDRNGLLSLALDSTFGTHTQSRTVASFDRFRDRLALDGRLSTDSRTSLGPTGTGVQVQFARSWTARDASLRQEITSLVGPRHRIEAGLELHRLRSRWVMQAHGDRDDPLAGHGARLPVMSGLPGAQLPSAFDTELSHLRAGLWVQDRVQLTGGLVVQPGVRLDYSGINGRTAVSPRLRAALDLGDATKLRVAVGRQFQSPGFEKLYQADDFVDLSLAGRLRNERSFCASTALERELSSGMSGRLELFGKSFSDLIVGRLETEDERRARVGQYDFPASLQVEIPAAAGLTSVPVNGATGYAYGLELQLVRRETRAPARITGWVSYAYGVSAREAYGRRYPADYDRRHALSVVVQLRLRQWLELAATGRVASGFPRTPAMGVRVAARADQDDVDRDGNRTELKPVYGVGEYGPSIPDKWLVYTYDFGTTENLNTARMPLYARLDARLTVQPGGSGGRFQLYFDVVNLLNRRNAAYVSSELSYPEPGATRPAIVERRAMWLPFLPNVGARFRF